MTESNNPQQEAGKTPQNKPRQTSDKLGDFLAFREFATPVLVQLVFWIGTLAFIVWGTGMIEAAQHPWRDTNTAMVWAGLAVMVGGPALLRISGELVLVVFRIHERLGALAPKGD